MGNFITDNEGNIILKKLSFYRKPLKGTYHFFTSYYIDKFGSVYTGNPSTHFTKFGKLLVKSNGVDNTVTLRDAKGGKVSIKRKNLIAIFRGTYGE